MLSFRYRNETVKFTSLPNDHIARSWAYETFYEQRLLEKIKSMNITGTYVDVGSHHGNHTVFFAKFCTNKVISLEGNPFNFQFLVENVGQNQCNCTTLNKIVSDVSGQTLHMTYNLQNTGMSRVADLSIPDGSHIASNTTTTLDDELSNEGHIGLIKIDVENFEWNVLKGAKRTILKHAPVIVIELHNDNPHIEEIRAFLKKNGYSSDGKNYAHSPTFIFQKNGNK